MSPVHWGTVDIVEIPPYTEEEAKYVWYDGQEMQHISSTLWKTVDQLNRERAPLNGSKDDDDHCTRGLEEMTTRGTLARLMAKYSIDQAVFEEQKKQKERGTKDARALANASIAESNRYVHKALEYGFRDQESADEYLNRPSASTETTSSPQKNPWFKRMRRRGRECRSRPGMATGMSLRRLLGMGTMKR